MVILRIKDNATEDKAKVSELTFHLHLDGGNLYLYANDSIDNSEWEILSITSEGKYLLSTGLPNNIGLQTTKNGCIKRE